MIEPLSHAIGVVTAVAIHSHRACRGVRETPGSRRVGASCSALGRC